MHTEIIEEVGKTTKPEKNHIGNAKLSTSKKAVKVNIFKTNKFYVISLAEITENSIGKVYEYVEGEPEIVGEIITSTNSKFYEIKIDENIYFLKQTYVQLFKNGSGLILPLYEEK
jgi:hypothetical protein